MIKPQLSKVSFVLLLDSGHVVLLNGIPGRLRRFEFPRYLRRVLTYCRSLILSELIEMSLLVCSGPNDLSAGTRERNFVSRLLALAVLNEVFDHSVFILLVPLVLLLSVSIVDLPPFLASTLTTDLGDEKAAQASASLSYVE